MATPTVYVICDANCKWEGMTKEQILTAITQAVNNSNIGDIDTGFVQTIKTINGIGLRFFVGTQAQYNALTESDKQNLFAIITDDATKENIINILENLQDDIVSLGNRITLIYNELNTKNDTILNRLDKIGGMPTLNTNKCLDRMGYYYIEYLDVVLPMRKEVVGVVFYSPNWGQDVVIGMPYGGTLHIDPDGNMTVIDDGKDFTHLYRFYTALMIGY